VHQQKVLKMGLGWHLAYGRPPRIYGSSACSVPHDEDGPPPAYGPPRSAYSPAADIQNSESLPPDPSFRE